MSHSERVLRSVAGACFKNAADLQRSAEVLRRKDQREHSLALACVGIEEFGKAVVYTLAALLPDQRDRISDEIRGHHAKRWVFTQVRDIVTSLRQSAAGFTIEESFARLAKSGLDDVLLSDHAARKRYAQLNKGALNPAKLKNDALYVDLQKDGTLRVPAQAARAVIYCDMHAPGERGDPWLSSSTSTEHTWSQSPRWRADSIPRTG